MHFSSKIDPLFFLDINAKIPILSTMKPTYRKSIAWIMLSAYLMLAPVPQWNNGNMVLCVEDACADCHDGIVFASPQDQCSAAEDACRESSGCAPEISDPHPEKCFCCVEIPISKYIYENTPLSRPHDPSGGIHHAIAQSLPGSHPSLNKASFPSSPNPHIVTTPKALRSVVLII